MKVVPLDRKYWPRGGWGHWCPGCNSGHEIDTEEPNASGAKWTFNGDRQAPTFTPSVNMRWGTYVDPNLRRSDGSPAGGVCHYIITAGKITYCADSTHALSGQTVDLPEIPAHAFVTSQHAARTG